MKRNIIRSFVGMQINLESVIQSEMSQNEKSKYCIVMHIYIYMESRKNGTDEPICRAGIGT